MYTRMTSTSLLLTQQISLGPDAVIPGLFPQVKGIDCTCSHSPFCRHHHRAKQAEGWRLEQPEPGVLI